MNADSFGEWLGSIDWAAFWKTTAAVVPVATVVTLVVNWISSWFVRPRPMLVFESQIVRAHPDPDLVPKTRHDGAIAVTNVGTGAAFRLTFDGHLADAALRLPPLVPGWSKERLVDWVPKLDPGETIVVHYVMHDPLGEQAIVFKWRNNPGRRFLRSWVHMKSVNLSEAPVASFMPLGALDPTPLPKRFRRFKDLTRYSTRRDEWRGWDDAE